MIRLLRLSAAFLAACGPSIGSQATSGIATAPACMPSIHPLTTAAGWHAYVEAPEIVERRAELFFFGAPAFALQLAANSTMGFSDPLSGVRVRRAEVTLLPRPAADSLDFIRAAVTPDDQVTLLWRRNDISPDTEQVMWSALGNKGWSEPAPVAGLTAPGAWRRVSVSQSTSIDRSMVMVAASVSQGRLLFWSGRGWASRRLDDHTGLYSSIVQTAKRNWVLGYVGYAEPDGNTVFVRRSSDQGASWGPPIRVSGAGTGRAYDAQVFALSGNMLAMIWTVGEGLLNREIRVSTSDDGGLTWTVKSSWEPSGMIISMRAVRTGDRRIGVAVQVRHPNGRMTPEYLEWSGEWKKLWVAPDSLETFGQVTIAKTRNAAVLAWGEAARLGRRIPVTRYLIVPDCFAAR